MTAVPPTLLPEARVWQRIRRYAVPATMIEACAAARSAGDWRTACAAGRIDVAVDLADLAREHSRRQAERIEGDLTALAPDLLRWHLPRVLGGRTSLATHQQWLLSTHDDRFADTDLALLLHTPKTVDGSQRLRLTVGPARQDLSGRRDLPPPFWSAAHVDGLATAYGGSAGRLPGFTPDGDVLPFDAYATTVDPADPATRTEVFERYVAAGALADAWAVAGLDLDPDIATGDPTTNATVAAVHRQFVPLGLPTELTRLHRRYGVDRAMIGGQWRILAAVRRRDDGGTAVSFPGYDRDNFSHLRMADVVHDRPVDLELLRTGLLDHTGLHPLVRQALFPSATPGPPAAGAEAGADAASAATGGVTLRVPVRCGGRWHTLVHADGRLDPVSHTPEEIARERMLVALGGPTAGCVAAVRAWHGSGDRLPRPLKQLRRDVLQRIQHGGSAALTALLDAGLDPRMGDGRGGTLLHHLRALDDVTPLHRLVEAGVPVDAPDRRGRTALHVAVGDGGTPELVAALLAAGADPKATDGNGWTVTELADGKASMYDYDDEGDPEHPQVRIRDLVEEWVKR
ncbi:ankyrin repeat domain-containing protein [Micromonospora echinofusca]|uniref:Ankyrin repeat-containing protein n=1 Tax=Micromonospora echinofusca TaxID=47858 RepID=A0ABS3VVU3_MICEH|nr:ankyrin repeat domain-containing protein [Micromonospora echinofusca]MBO4208671.1 hypothetical protein [Micromonospora echinofusca]